MSLASPAVVQLVVFFNSVRLAKSTLLCFSIVINLIFCFRYDAYIELVESHYASRTFYVFCIKTYIESKCEDLSTAKVLYPPVVCATDNSKAVVLVLFLLFVWPSGFYHWAFRVESFLALCSRFLSPI